MTASISINFLSEARSRRTIRLVTLIVYFVLFQFFILLQKPFLQLDFIFVFYSAFSGLFAHHLFGLFKYNTTKSIQSGLKSYLFDFIVLIFFMKYFPYLSSFILVLQLFLLFVASFDLSNVELSILGFVSSLGVSLINISMHQAGSIQSLLSLTLFNLSYLSVIIVSRQLRTEFFTLQSDLSLTWKKWKSQEEFSKILIEKLPFGLAVVQNNNEFILQNSYLTDKLKLTSESAYNLISLYQRRKLNQDSDIASGEKIYNFDQATYFDEEIKRDLKLYLIRDVTDLRLMEKQLKEKEKLAATLTLAAGIAHEIRNPLAGISGSIQMLSQEIVPNLANATQKKLMDIVLKEIDRLNLLITEFLDYAKPEKAPDSKVDLLKIIEEVVASLKYHPDLKTGFIWKVNLKSTLILGISEKLKQALLNIIINSIQAMKNSEPASLEITLNCDEFFAIVSIKDTGLGMTEETRKKMFEPFHTTKPKGTGLGLAITHKILDLHKAQIKVKSELNLGTEFIIKFPLNTI